MKLWLESSYLWLNIFKNSLDDFLLVVELECLRVLVHELPCGVDELGEYWRDLFAVAGQVTASV